MSQFDLPISVWQYREPSELSITTSLSSETSTVSIPSTDLTSITTSDPSEMSASMQAWVDFHSWIMSEPVENRMLYRNSCRALLIDLDNSFANESPATETINAANDEQALETTDGSNEDELPPAPLTPAPSASPTFLGEDVEIPRLRPQHTSQRSNSAPASSRPASSCVTFDHSTDLTVSPVHVNNRIVTTGTVIHHKPRLLPDVLYTGRTPPFWRWSNSDLPVICGISGGEMAPHPLGRTGVRDDSAMWETISYSSDHGLNRVESTRSVGSGYPPAPGGATMADEAEFARHVGSNEFSGGQEAVSTKKGIFRRMGRALMRKLKDSRS